MTAFLSWVDFSSADRDRMRQAIALFQEQNTVDELGFGTLRDAFADAFSPGTSTIQTRLRYFLFVPWLYRKLEEKGVSAEKVGRRAREAEIALIEPLLASADTEGAIGKRARDSLKRLPSSIYWSGLQTWKILDRPISKEQYERAFDVIRTLRRGATQADDEGVARDRFVTWQPRLPSPPPNWPEKADFQLTLEEASFIQGRIATSCPGTLLAWLAMDGGPSDVAFPWLHPDCGRLPQQLAAALDLGRRFSLIAHGASLLYNVMLSDLAQADAWVDGHTESFRSWAEGDEAEDLRTFDLEELWRFVDAQRANVPTPSRRFVTQWVHLLASKDPRSLLKHDEARSLVKSRERALKGVRSRYTNRRALDQWGGSSGTGRLDYRWGITQGLIRDLHAGLHGES